MEKEPKRMVFGAAPLVLFLALPLVFVGFDFLSGDSIWVKYFSGAESSSPVGEATNKTAQDQDFFRFRLSRLVKGEDKRKLISTGFACDRTYHSVLCVANHPVRIDTRNMTVYVPSDNLNSSAREIIIPYARQEDCPKSVTPVHVIHSRDSPVCQYEHRFPAVIFSSGSLGNVFHEMNEIIIPLFITTQQFKSRVTFVLEDYSQKFMGKYGKVVNRLSGFRVINPAVNGSVHCFPGSIIGLRYHDNLALNSSEIPGGVSMRDFRHFLRQAYGLRFSHVSQIARPRLMLLSRTNTRRFLNEADMIELIKELGFDLIVVKRSKVVSNLNTFAQMINSCSVLVGAHGAGLTNEIFLPSGAVMVQVELIGTEWASNTYYGDTARAMDVHYLRYKIEQEESSLMKVHGRNSSVLTDQASVYLKGGYRAARTAYLDQQNVRVDMARFRRILVEALSIVTDLDVRK